MKPFRLALLFGGPSQERGISLNSARSVLDHLSGPDVELVPVFYDWEGQAHLIDTRHLYSNTPADFDFKLKEIGCKLDEEAWLESMQSVDFILPVIHGEFGEGGDLFAQLEKHNLPYLGSSSEAARRAFDKYDAAWFMEREGFYSSPCLLLEAGDDASSLARVESFFDNNELKKAVLKPSRSGSSIGVTLVHSPEETLVALKSLIEAKVDERFVLEPFCSGKEFTVIVLQNAADERVALLPAEIEITDPEASLFDYRLKYLPTPQVAYHMPPRFGEDVIELIRSEAERLHWTFGLTDAVRLDGWVLDDGSIWFSDINLASGMEQNSFFFLQGAYLGFTHRQMLRFIVHQACARRGIEGFSPEEKSHEYRKPVRILFGGNSSERQVSLMSGTNVWLKLLKSEEYQPEPYLLDTDGFVWHLPYPAALRHTVEEVGSACHEMLEERSLLIALQQEMGYRLLDGLPFTPTKLASPVCQSLQDFCEDKTPVFIALHGGIGENGELQELFLSEGVPFTGSYPAAARLCMDKYLTGQALENSASQGVFVAPKKKLDVTTLLGLEDESLKKIWDAATTDLKQQALIVKPMSDGCSSGIAKLCSVQDFVKYNHAIRKGVPRLMPGYLESLKSMVEMPAHQPDFLLLEPFIESDRVRIEQGQIQWEKRTGWIEATVGVYGERGQLHAMKPSIAVASGDVLSLEEKFQGGTGINITPPPAPWVSESVWESARKKIALVANKLGIHGFARIDAFINTANGDIMVIEANTIPGLTPSTVIYHQALAEEPSMTPTRFLETILEYVNESLK